MQTTLKQRAPWRAKLSIFWWLLAPITATVTLLCTEWIHRGSLSSSFWTDNFLPHFGSFACSWLLILCTYLFLANLTRLPALAVVLCGAGGCIPATVTYFKLKLRGEPFFPWDLSQGAEAADVVGKAGLELQTSMWVSALVFLALAAFACLVPRPRKGVLWQFILSWAAPGAGGLALLFLVFLSPTGSRAVGIVPDMWMQNRYYRNYGVIAGFLTNIQNLEVDEPEDYSEETVNALVEQSYSQDLAPVFEGSYAQGGDGQVTQPNIIFIMDESFWDVQELEEYGVVFDQPVTPNLHRLMETSAYGKAYSPSFGGGTCDVEFEALTGFSVEFLPSGCKPFQQHVTHPMFSLPWVYPRKADIMIAGCGGYPKDMSLYQGTKTIDNVEPGLKIGGTLVLLAECRDGGGPAEYFNWIHPLAKGTLDPELRKNFTIPGYIFYLNCEQARRYRILMLTSVDPAQLAPMGIQAFSNVEELLAQVDFTGKLTYIIENGSTVIPRTEGTAT